MKINEFMLMANNARMNAEEVRTISETYTNKETKKIMMDLADDYDLMARNLTKLSGE